MSLLEILCFLLILGVFIGFYIKSIWIIAFSSIIILSVFIKFFIFEKRKKQIIPFIIGIIFISAFYIGIIYGYNSTYVFEKYEPFYNNDIAVKGEVVYIPSNKSFFDVKVRMISNGDDALEKCRKIRVYSNENVDICDVLIITGMLKPYHLSRFYGDYNSRFNNMADNIFGYVTPNSVKQWFNYRRYFDLTRLGHFIRYAVINKVDIYIGENNRGFLKALLAGDKSELSDSINENLRISGLSHIIAVSGLHLAVFISIFGNWFYVFEKRLYSVLLTIIIVFLYSLGTGCSPSVLRAGVMLVISLIISNLAIRSDPLTNLIFASALICTVNPFYTQDIGFQLSFLSVFAILLFVKNPKNKFAVPLSVILVISPVCAYYFNSVAFGTVFANILISPVIAFLLPLGYLMLFFPFIKYIVSLLTSLAIFIINVFGSFKIFNLKVPSPSLMYFSFHIAFVMLIYFIINKKGKRICIKTSVVAMLLLTMTVFQNNYINNCTKVNFYEKTGVIRTPDKKVIVIANDNKSVISGILESANIDTVDVYILPHLYGSGKYVLKDTADKFNIKEIYIPQNEVINDKEMIFKSVSNSKLKYYDSSKFDFDDVSIVTKDGNISIFCGKAILSSDGRKTYYIKDNKINSIIQ